MCVCEETLRWRYRMADSFGIKRRGSCPLLAARRLRVRHRAVRANLFSSLPSHYCNTALFSVSFFIFDARGAVSGAQG